ncbi:MAG: hypothetical protein LBR33_05910, partial [Propionibacteriaceae bacterium]|nr:hypothetical protein [Propionibacteriaceae bacterium]
MVFVIRRVCVVGNAASGKSCLADRIGLALGVPVHHLDRVYWRADWTHVSRAEFLAAQKALVSGEAWVIDGCFSEYGLRERFAAADLVVFLDVPALACVRRAVARRGGSHVGLPDGADDSRMALGRTVAFLAEMLLFPVL